MRLGVIGGSSLLSLEVSAFTDIGLKQFSKEDVVVDTPFGHVRLTIIVLEGAPCFPMMDRGLQHTIIFLPRQQGGKEPPHSTNHLANIRALADMKVDAIVATTSVGTLVTSFPPGRVGIAQQYIDFSGVAVTFHDKEAKFTSLTEPFDEELNRQLAATLRRVQSLDKNVRLGFAYWLSTGPQYETAAEVNAIDRLGGEVCGFTMPREAKLCAELGIPYAALLVATNWAAGRHPGDNSKDLSHQEFAECAAQRVGVLVACLVDLLKKAIRKEEGPPRVVATVPSPPKRQRVDA